MGNLTDLKSLVATILINFHTEISRSDIFGIRAKKQFIQNLKKNRRFFESV